jgi:hypothetical protein
MPTDRENFEAWFVRPLQSLFEREEFGFIIVMVTLPLLERYLRQKAKLHSDKKLNDTFFVAFEELFPLGGKAKKFWRMCRNGLLHQSTFSGRGVFIVHGQSEPLAVDHEAFFRLEPVIFAQKVLAAILSGFEDYVSMEPPLPKVFWLLAPGVGPPMILGTGAPLENPGNVAPRLTITLE